MKKEKGFTVIELLVVMGLIAIIASMIIGLSGRAIGDAAYSAGVNKLISEINSVKGIAAKNNCLVMLEFNNDGKSFAIYRQTNLADPDPDNYLLVRSGTFLDHDTYNESFFNKGQRDVLSFVVNSMGMVYKKSEITSSNPIPRSISIDVQFTYSSTTESDNITVSPSGGINVSKTKRL